MAQPDTFHIQMPFGNTILDTYDREILDTAGRNILDLGWADINGDVLTENPIVIFQGQRSGSDPRDRVADAGTIKFEMNNSASNSLSTVGIYSPDNVNRLPRFTLGAKVRIWLTKDAVTDYLTQGRIIDIKVTTGLLGDKRVDVTAGDWIELAARTAMPRIEVQETVTDDEVLQTIVTALGTDAPDDTDFEVGDYEYDYALTDVDDESTPILSVLQSLGQSGQGRIFVTGSSTSGEVLRYVNLVNLLSTGTPVTSFVDDFMDSEARRAIRTRARRFVGTAYPMQKDASAVVLFTLTSEAVINAGNYFDLVGYFRDPNGNSQAKIAAVDIVQPVAGTDFNFSTISGSGSGLNASFNIISWEVGAKSFHIRAQNTSGSTGYLWEFQVRGKGLYPYDEVGYTAVDTSIAESEGISVDYPMPYQSSLTTLTEIVDALLAWYSVENTSMPFIEFVPSLSENDFEKMLVAKPGELIAVTESVSGISYNMIVIGRELRIWNNGKYIMERLYIIPTLQTESGLYFTLDTIGQDDLDGTNTILAFGS